MRASQVLDMQADLDARLHEEKFALMTKDFLTSAYVVSTDDTVQHDAPRMLTLMQQHIRMSEAYRVTDDMSMLVQFSATQLDESDHFDRTFAPSEWGIVRFDRPLPMKDVRHKTMLNHWLTWGPVSVIRRTSFGTEQSQAGLLTTWWNDVNDPDEVFLAMVKNMPASSMTRLRRVMGRWVWSHSEIIVDGSSLGPVEEEVPPWTRAKLISDGVVEPSTFTNLARYVHALFLLLNQTVTTISEEPIPKSARKRMGRMPIPGRVSVIALRRQSTVQHVGESMVTWSHRWPVRGCWQWRACGADHPGAVEYEKGWRVRIYVAAYLKGPAGLPIVAPRHVYDLRR